MIIDDDALLARIVPLIGPHLGAALDATPDGALIEARLREGNETVTFYFDADTQTVDVRIYDLDGFRTLVSVPAAELGIPIRHPPT